MSKVQEKIIEKILAKNLAEALKQIPDKGNYVLENQYELGTHPKYPDLYFVSSIKMSYHNHSITGKEHGLYAFDKKTGEEVPNFQNDGKCTCGFFKDMDVIKQIV